MNNDPAKRNIDVAILGAFLRDCEVYPTGSRVICPQVVPPVSDWDYLVLVNDQKAAIEILETKDFKRIGENYDGQETDFASMKLGDINAIVTGKRDFFEKFKLATRVAMQLGLTVKSQRIILFQAILYGKG